MIKQIKEIITSKLFIFIFLISLFSLCIYSINYSKTTNNYYPSYSINYSRNIEDYDEEIEELREKIDALDESYNSKEDYESSKKYYENMISIYESLKQNNIDYSYVYDFGNGSEAEFLLYLNSSQNIITLLLIINGLVLIYLLFSKEFDNNSYSMIYSQTRYKIILKKLGVFAIFIIFEMLVLILLNLFISNTLMDRTFSEVLVLHNNNVKYISISNYVFNYNVMSIIYNTIFMLIILLTCCLFFKKTLYVLISAIVIFVIYILLNFLCKDILVYLGLSLDFDILSYYGSILIRLIILIPISLLVGSVICFEKADI